LSPSTFSSVQIPEEHQIPDWKMVRLLLENGANPNEADGTTTLWVRYLERLARISQNPDWLRDSDDVYHTTRELVNHGADVGATCLVRGKSLTVTQVLQEVLTPEQFETLGNILCKKSKRLALRNWLSGTPRRSKKST
jgi:hypothetical protein